MQTHLTKLLQSISITADLQCWELSENELQALPISKAQLPKQSQPPRQFWTTCRQFATTYRSLLPMLNKCSEWSHESFNTKSIDIDKCHRFVDWPNNYVLFTPIMTYTHSMIMTMKVRATWNPIWRTTPLHRTSQTSDYKDRIMVNR